MVDKDHNDLLQEAIRRTLAGERHWRRGVDFHRHLDVTMQSICDSWLKHLIRVASAGATEIHAADVGGSAAEHESLLDTVEDEHSDQLKTLIAREQLARLRASFQDDVAVSEIIAGWEQGLTGPDIQTLAGLTKQEFESAVRRLRYALARKTESTSVH